MKPFDSITFKHNAETLPEALGLNEEHAKDAQNRVMNVAKETSTVSGAAETLIKDYQDDPAKLLYSLLILENVERENMLSSLMAGVEEEA